MTWGKRAGLGGTFLLLLLLLLLSQNAPLLYNLLLTFLCHYHTCCGRQFRLVAEKNYIRASLLFLPNTHHHHHHYHSLNREGRWGTTDDFATSFLHFSLFSTAVLDLPISRPVHYLMLSSHFFLCLPCLLPLFTVPCKMVLARPDERET